MKRWYRRRVSARSTKQIAEEILSIRPSSLLVDFFDTLVARSIAPERVKDLAAIALCRSLNLESTASTIRAERARLEGVLRREYRLAGLDGEFALDELSTRLYSALSDLLQTRGRIICSDFVRAAVETEVRIELAVQEPNRLLIQTLRTLKREGANVYLVSDSFIPASQFERLLRQAGLIELFDDVFLSCQARKSKRSGRLYALARERIQEEDSGEPPVMIGDHPGSDYGRASQAGLNPLLVRRKTPEFHKGDESIWKSIANAVCREDTSDVFPEMALTLYYVIRRLYSLAHRNAIGRLFFVSREGLLLRELFEIFQETSPLATLYKVSTHYLLASRRSTWIASREPLDVEEFEAVFERGRHPGYRSFLSTLGFSERVILELLRFLRAEADQPIELETIRSCSSFRSAYEGRRREQRKLLLSYLESFGSTDREKTRYLVDVGWKGTVQDHLSKLWRDKMMIHGFYVGLHSQSRSVANRQQKTALLFESSPDRSRYFPAFSHFKSIYETLLSAGHGGVNGYKWEGGRSVPELDEKDEEKEMFDESIRPVQKRMKLRFREICRLASLLEEDIEDCVGRIARHHGRMMLLPTREEIDFVAGMRHYENFGHVRVVRFGEGEAPGLLGGMKALAQMVRSPRSVVSGGGWPALKLSRAGLGWLVPAYGRYRQLLMRDRASHLPP